MLHFRYSVKKGNFPIELIPMSSRRCGGEVDIDGFIYSVNHPLKMKNLRKYSSKRGFNLYSVKTMHEIIGWKNNHPIGITNPTLATREELSSSKLRIKTLSDIQYKKRYRKDGTLREEYLDEEEVPIDEWLVDDNESVGEDDDDLFHPGSKGYGGYCSDGEFSNDEYSDQSAGDSNGGPNDRSRINGSSTRRKYALRKSGIPVKTEEYNFIDMMEDEDPIE